MKNQTILNIPLTTFFSLWVFTVMSSFITEDNNITLAVLSALSASLTVLIPVYLIDNIYYNNKIDISFKFKLVSQAIISVVIALSLLIHSIVVMVGIQVPDYIISSNTFVIFIFGGIIILISQYLKFEYDIEEYK